MPQTNEMTGGTKFTFGLTRAATEREGFPVSHQCLATIDLGAREPMRSTDMAKVVADAEIVTSLLKDHPDEMVALFNSIVAGRDDEAKEIATRLDLNEESFQRQEGGMWFWIGMVGVVILGCVAFGCDK
ncbi:MULTISPECIES: hypothetical protein [unclassified Streptomyces]|uniref:hypothetical protein n=1 Tax=unclassified Streptomyces TaxID=2593676 RepID=UPI003246E035